MSATLGLASRVVWLSEQPHLGATLFTGFKATFTAHGISSGWRKASGLTAQGSFPVMLLPLAPGPCHEGSEVIYVLLGAT